MFMWEFILYLGQSAVCLAALYLLYKATMSYETLHRLNRVVLLGSVVLAAVLPLCHIKIEKEVDSLSQIVEDGAMEMVAAHQGLDSGAIQSVKRLITHRRLIEQIQCSKAYRRLPEI